MPRKLDDNVPDGVMLGNDDFPFPFGTGFFTKRRLVHSGTAVVNDLAPVTFHAQYFRFRCYLPPILLLS